MTTARNRARHYLISGKVQGVYYRLSAGVEARQLGLVGWVRNLTDGRVEALAVGEPVALEKFERWLWQGPVRARVDGVRTSNVDACVNTDFIKRETANTPHY
ncbi:MAG TPA: acylphosphatase [Cellvibrionaceae bacterium]